MGGIVKTLPTIILFIVFAAFSTIFSHPLSNLPEQKTFEVVQEPSQEAGERARVVRVIDGDTIEVEGGLRVRYIGINAPESSKKYECFAESSTKKNRDFVLGKEIFMEKDISETDKYGRLLRYVYIGEVFVNDEIVKQGYAKVSTYPPDVKYQTQFLESQKYARDNNLGLWRECTR